MANTKITAANIDSTSTGFTLADLTVDTTTLVVDATNNRVGIGTASPASTLEVNNTSAGDTVATFEGDYGAGGDVQLVRYERGGGAVYGAISYKDATTDMEFGNISSHALSFITANTRRLTIDSNGDIGINTSSPIDGSKLDVVDSDDMTMRVRSTGSSSAAIRFQNSTTGTTTNDGLFVGIGTDETGYVWHYDNNPLAFATNNTERMRIDSSGKLLIGDSASHVDDLLQIETPASGGGHGIQIRRNDSNTDQGIGRIMFGNNTDTDLATISAKTDGATDSGAILFSTQATGGSSSERMRIDSSGRLQVGLTNAPISGYDSKVNLVTNGGSYYGIMIKNLSTSNSNAISFINSSNAATGYIEVTTSSTSYNTSSDARLKDITGEARGLEVINELNPVSYNWKVDGKADEGLIAQEVLEIVPNAVSGSEEEMYQMDYSKLVVHLVKGMKEQQAQIEALQSEINLLKGE